MGASLAGEISGSRSRRGYRIATIGYATVVFAVLAALAIGGALLAVLAFPNPFAIVIGVVMVGAAFVARPRPTPVPAGLIDRDRFPALFGLADRVADELHAHRVDGIRITNDFNASFGRYGWRGRRIISLGFPLITVLDGRQLVAVIAHEIAHDVNGDPSRQTYVGLAYGAVLELHGLLAPVDRPVSVTRVTTSTILVGVGAPIANTVMRGLSLATRPFVVAFEVLMRRQSQRAEYLADALAADVAGHDACLSLLRTMHFSQTLAATAGALVASGETDDLFGRLRRRIADTPEREWQRIDRVMDMEQTQLESTHPPTAQRIRLLSSRPDAAPRVVVDADEQFAIDRELLPLEVSYARDQLEDARDRLYRR